jgi:hypothetical protein
MVTDRQQALPPSSRKGPMGRRRRPVREPVFVWWIVFGALALLALEQWSWRVLLLLLALWCCYEVALIPVNCRVQPNGGETCANPVRGRVFGCSRAHQEIKNDALWRLGGLSGNPFRKQPAADPNRETGELVWSPNSRGSMDIADRAVLLLAAAGTIIAIAGMAFGLTV